MEKRLSPDPTQSTACPSPGVEPLSERWSHIRKLLERSGPFCQPGFSPSPRNLEIIRQSCRLLVVGAGGLGCELLKNLALLGFCNIHVIDMDTIDISNLNRQFLFRNEDVGKSKAEVAALVINKRIPGVSVVPHFCKIQDKDEEFYSSFHVIICGLDSIVARRWLNGMVLSLVEYDESGAVKEESLIPVVDGGTEGFKGNARVIIPTKTPCIECTLDLYPPQVNFPLCTIAQTPRLPEHCIEYARIILWPKENSESPIDGDDPAHINWIYERAMERANEFKIPGVTYRLTQGVIKHIIPAVSSTNAAIASVCATETFKIVSGCSKYLENYNYMVYSDLDGIYTYTYAAEKSDDCLACSQKPRTLSAFSPATSLLELIEYLIESREYQMKSPGITATLPTGKQKTLYMKLISQTETNLTKSLGELGVENGTQITVADETTPIARTFIINYNMSNPNDNS